MCTGFSVSLCQMLEFNIQGKLTTKNIVNMKFTIDWCVFGYQDNQGTIQNTQCKGTCNYGLQAALLDRILQTNSTLQYQYCQTGDGAFSKGVQECIACLESVPHSKSLAKCMSPLTNVQILQAFNK